MKCSLPVGPLAILHIIESFRTLVVHLGTKISICIEMGFSSNFDKMSKMYFKCDADSYKSEDFLLNPISILLLL